MGHPLAEQATRTQAQELHALTWERRADVVWPPIIERAIRRVLDAAAKPHCPLYSALLYGTSVGGKKERVREKRSDGGQNALALLCALIAGCDLMSGLVATPVGTLWRRKSYYDLDGLAYGEQVPGARSFKRTKRNALVLTERGLIKTNRWKRKAGGTIKDEPGHKFVTEQCWKILGLWAAVKRERRRKRQEAAQQKAAQLMAAITQGSNHRAKLCQNQAAGAEDKTPFGLNEVVAVALASSPATSANKSQAPPAEITAATATAAACIAHLKDLLGD